MTKPFMNAKSVLKLVRLSEALLHNLCKHRGIGADSQIVQAKLMASLAAVTPLSPGA